MRRSAAMALVAALAAAASLATTTAAQAKPVSKATPMSAGRICGDGATTYGTLTFCDSQWYLQPSWPSMEYNKWGGGTITAQFWWYNPDTGGSVWDNGAFTESAGQDKSFAWSGQPYVDNCGSVYGGMWVYGQNSNFVTKSISIC